MNKLSVIKILFVLSLLLYTPVVKGDVINQQQARNQALSFGADINGQNSNILSEDNKNNIPGYTTDNPEQARYYNDSSTIAGDAANQLNISGLEQFMSKDLPNRPQIEVSLNDPFLRSSENITNNPDEILKMMTEEYSDCTPLTQQQKPAGENFSCIAQKKYNEQSCDRILEISCVSKCISGIDISSISGGSNFLDSKGTIESINPWNYDEQELILTIGQLPQPEYRRGLVGQTCKNYWQSVDFNIPNLNDVESFVLISAGFDDYLQIKINNNIVATIPSGGLCPIAPLGGLIGGGRDPYYVAQICPNESKSLQCQLGGPRTMAQNLPLKQYLKQGRNNITLLVIHGNDSGGGWAKFQINSNCCKEPKEEWKEVCQ